MAQPMDADTDESYAHFLQRIIASRTAWVLVEPHGVDADFRDALLINPAWVNRSIFEEMHFIEVNDGEPSAANAVWIDTTVIYPSSFPRTQRLLEEAGRHLQIVDATEVAKAEGAVTCCSLIFQAV